MEAGGSNVTRKCISDYTIKSAFRFLKSLPSWVGVRVWRSENNRKHSPVGAALEEVFDAVSLTDASLALDTDARLALETDTKLAEDADARLADDADAKLADALLTGSEPQKMQLPSPGSPSWRLRLGGAVQTGAEFLFNGMAPL